MSLLTRTVNVQAVSNGKTLTVSIPAAFAREIGIQKGDALHIRFDPKKNVLILSVPDSPVPNSSPQSL